MLFNKTKTLVFLFTLFISSFTFSQSEIYLETEACVANTNTGLESATSLTLIYTDSDSSTILSSSDNVDTTTSDTNIDFTGSTPYYYVEYGQLRKVSFSTMPATGMVAFDPENATCDSTDDGDDGETDDDGISPELITLTINGLSGDDKAYDGTTDATASGTPILVGLES